MAETPVVVYLHGFASSPLSHKARFFAERLGASGITLSRPDLNEGEGGFTGLTFSRARAQLAELLEREGATERGVILLGSSFGAYTAALQAARDGRVRAQVLLAPAFDFAGRFPERLGAEAMARWRSEGTLEVPHAGTRRVEKIGFSLVRDALGHPPYPAAPCPTLVLHGVRDEVVPVELARRFATREPGTVRLVELDSDHELLDVKEALWAETARFLAPWLPSLAASASSNETERR